MKNAPIPENESSRLLDLLNYKVLDSEAEPQFDEIVKMASLICHTPIALVSLVDAERQWFKAHQGLDATETSRDISFCGHAIHSKDVFIVPDTEQDVRFHDNPLVTGDPNIKFYAGAPLITKDNHVVGTLCVIDHKPRYLNGDQIQLLKYLANQVIVQLELRKTLSDQAECIKRVGGLSEIVQTQDDKFKSLEKLQLMTDMSAGICHEINNPLAVILLGVEQLKRQIKKISDQQPLAFHSLERISASAQKISDIISGLKTYSDGTGKNRSLIPVKNIIDEVIKLSQDKITIAQISVSYSGDETALIYGSPKQIFRVFQNLLTNAIDAVEDLPERWIKFHITRTNLRTTRIRVIDSGTGIEPEIEQKIMQPFFTTKDSQKGTGLGLAICRGIILEHNGEFRYEKYHGHTSFVVELND